MDFFIKHSAPFMKLCRSVILYAESVIFQGPQMRLANRAISGPTDASGRCVSYFLRIPMKNFVVRLIFS